MLQMLSQEESDFLDDELVKACDKAAVLQWSEEGRMLFIRTWMEGAFERVRAGRQVH